MPESNKTEKATPRRRQKAREKGQVPRTRELAPALTVLAVTAAVWWRASDWPGEWRDLFARLLAASASGSGDHYEAVLRSTALVAFSWMAPAAAGVVVAVMAGLAQGGLLITPAALAPQASRFNPVLNAQRLFSVEPLKNALKAVVPTAVLGYLVVCLFSAHWQEFQYSQLMSARASLAWLFGLMFEVMWKGALVFAAWSTVDYLLERFHYERSLRMSRDEIREEAKETEGNPAIRGRIRRVQKQMRRRRMARNVSQATVVVTNPTEFAVALKYLPGEMEAPVVIAKGRYLLAQAIRREAIWHGIPIVENPPLARALYRAVEVDQAIPAKLYAAMAEILAFLYRTQQWQSRRGNPRHAGDPGNAHL